MERSMRGKSVRVPSRFLRMIAVGVVMAMGSGNPLQARAVDPQRQAELKNLLTQDCGACHGARLAGGLGPPLQASALAGKPPQYLIATILYGRPGTAMPPWYPFLTEAEAAWLVEILTHR